MRFNIATVTKTVIIYISAILAAIAILTLAPKSLRQRQIQQALRNIAERKAQMERRKAEIESELRQMQRSLKAVQAGVVAIALTAKPVSDRQPLSLPDPWDGAVEITLLPATPFPQQHRWQLCLPAAHSEQLPQALPQRELKAAPVAIPKDSNTPKRDYSKLSIRELKAIASQRKVKGYGSLKKSQLVAALTKMDREECDCLRHCAERNRG